MENDVDNELLILYIFLTTYAKIMENYKFVMFEMTNRFY